MFVGIEPILMAFDDAGEDAVHWKIYSSAKTETPMYFSDTLNATRATNRDRLAKVLNQLGYGTYRIEIKTELSNNRSLQSLHFEVRTPQMGYLPGIGSFQQNSTPQVPDGYMSEDKVKSAISGALKEYKKDIELTSLRTENEELKAENKELKKEVEEKTLLKFLDKFQESELGQGIGRLLLGKIPKINRSGIAGKDTTGMSIEERMGAVIDSFVELEGSEEQVVVLLEKMHLFATNNKELYENLKSQILN